jgi:hypothetical protein
VKKQPPVSRTVQLGNTTGSVTVTVTADLLRLNTSDREFVSRLIDELNAYEATSSRSLESP